MQEISLTGATMLTGHHGGGGGGNTSGNVTSNVTSGLVAQAHCDHHHHPHCDHHHQHTPPDSNASPPATLLNTTTMLTTTLGPPADWEHLVRTISSTQLATIVLQMIRLGVTFEVWWETIQQWIRWHPSVASPTSAASTLSSSYASLPTNTNTTTTTTTSSTTTTTATTLVYTAIRDYQDPEGRSFLHWATKRVDSIRFAQFLIQTVQCPMDRPSTDSTRMTPLHWACTLPSIHALPLIRLFVPTTTKTTTMTNTTTNNHHTNHNPLEINDSTGCTPLLIAAQHGHVETVAYLIQRGANVLACDEHGDSIVHWAAYKGSHDVLGLLAYYHDKLGHFWTKPDAYGQLPLHLAALRGHFTACRYILNQIQTRCGMAMLARVLLQKDNNGRTPQELAQHKEKYRIAALLQDEMELIQWKQQHRATPQRCQKVVTTIIRKFLSVQAWKVWLGMTLDTDPGDEAPIFPYYYLWTHIILHIFLYFTMLFPLFHREVGVLWDCMGWHVWNWIMMTLAIGSLRRTTTTNPGRLDDKHPRIQYWRKLYEITLESLAEEYDDHGADGISTQDHGNYADDEDDDDDNNDSDHLRSTLNDTDSSSNQQHRRQHHRRPPYQLCHTTHIARPFRSKFDRFTGCCIEVFDHHCPFVGASIGMNNYPYFFLFCWTMVGYMMGFWVLLIKYTLRTEKVTTFWLLVGGFSGLHILFPIGMVIYHTQLVWMQLTTNEHINARKYDYLWRRTRGQQDGGMMKEYYNRWDRGGWNNMYYRLVAPSAEALYLSPGSGSLETDSTTARLLPPPV